MSMIRTRWAAVGAAVAITLGAGGIGLVSATTPSNAVAFVPITPCRLFDTRPEFTVGSKASPLGPGETHTLTATGNNGNCTGIPATASAVSMNMTATDATAPTFLAVWATGEARPEASSLNPVPGAPPTPNAVTTELGAGGKFNVFNLAGSVHVFADINGYYVDHHHDDRYYTEDEVDAALASKAESDHEHGEYLGFGNTLQSAIPSNGASNSGGTVSFPDSGSPRMKISFGLPPGRVAGRPILVQIPFSGPPNCSFVLSASGVAGPFSDSTRFLNASWSVVGSPSGVVQLGPNPQGSASSTAVVTLSHNSSDRLGAGATVEMLLVREASNGLDTCTLGVSAVGGYSVGY